MLSLLATAPTWALEAPLAADAHVSTTVPNSNFGSAATLNVGGGSTALLRFDLSTLPAGTTANKLVKATLVLYVNRLGSAGEVDVQTVHSDWTEPSVNGNAAPVLSGAGNAITVALPGAGKYMSMDVTAQAKQWISNPGANYGLALTPALSSPGAVVFFDSKENTATGHVARLDLTLADQGPQGLPGATGTKGDKGDKGDAGPTGATGATGASGAQGISGVSGHQRVSRFFAMPTGFMATVAVTCPPGKKVLSGGVELPYGAPNTTLFNVKIHQSFPSGDRQWTVGYSNANNFIVDGTAWAVCASAL